MPKYAPTLPSGKVYESPFGLIEWSQYNPKSRPKFLERFLASFERMGGFPFNSWRYSEWTYALISSFANYYAGEKRRQRERKEKTEEFLLFEKIHLDLEGYFG